MAVNRKKSFEEQEQDLLNFPAFKYGEILSNDVENLVFKNDVLLSVNLKESILMVLQWKKEKQDNLGQLHPDENYACKCMGPTEKEIENARQRYWNAKQKSSMEVEEKLPVKSSKVMTPPRKATEKMKTLEIPIEVNKPEVKKPSLGFTSAREECLRQAAVNNRAPPAGVSSTAPSSSNSVRRYMGNRLVASKPNSVKDPEMEMNTVLEEGSECEDERLKGIDPKLLERLKIDVLAKPSSLSKGIFIVIE